MPRCTATSHSPLMSLPLVEVDYDHNRTGEGEDAGERSGRYVHVVEIDKSNKQLHILLGEHHEGNVRYKFDRQGYLESLTLTYLTAHELKPDALSGHPFAEKEFRWSPKAGCFTAGPFRPDLVTEAEVGKKSQKSKN
ncbi:MAG: hypothetical protein ABFD64_09290 [Armatimonadota bacterium]